MTPEDVQAIVKALEWIRFALGFLVGILGMGIAVLSWRLESIRDAIDRRR